MKLLHVIASVDLRGGGPAEWVRQVCRVSAAIGEISHVASLDSPDDEYVKRFEGTIHALGPSAGVYRYSPRFVPWLRENAGAYDCVISHGIWQYSSFGTWKALRGSRVPYFVYVHGMLDPWAKRAYPLKHIKKSLYWMNAESKVFREARAVFFTCEEERRAARFSFRPYGCREAVSPLGTAGPGQDLAKLRQTFLERFPSLKGRRVLLFLGRIHPKKACDLLIRAFADVAKQDSSLSLVMAGPDSIGWQTRLQELADELGIAERVLWTGMLFGDLKWQALAASELFMLPSHQEAFPVAIIESLGCGLPVLISDKVNMWREIEEAGAGLIVEDTVESTRRALQSWLNLPDSERAALRRRASACFSERYEARKAVAGLMGNLFAHGIGGRSDRDFA